jgi:hypothetical protein
VERFSDRARRVVALAQEEAGQLGHPHVGTEHLLLGLVVGGDGPASRALVSAGATPAATRAKVAEAVGRAGTREPGPRPFTTRAKRALDRAGRLSLQRRDEQVEPEHVLLSVLDVEGRAGQVLRVLGVDVPSLRQAIETPSPNRPSVGPVARERPVVRETPVPREKPAVRETPAAAGAAAAGVAAAGVAAAGVAAAGEAAAGEAAAGEAAAGVAAPRCPVCGTGLDGGLAFRVVAASGGHRGSRDFVVTYCAGCGVAIGATPG